MARRRLIIPRGATLRGRRHRVYMRVTKEMVEENWRGLYDPDKSTIHIDPNQSQEERERTYIHELLHAIWPQGIVDEPTEEALVEKLENRLHYAVAHGYLRAKGDK